MTPMYDPFLQLSMQRYAKFLDHLARPETVAMVLGIAKRALYGKTEPFHPQLEQLERSE